MESDVENEIDSPFRNMCIPLCGVLDLVLGHRTSIAKIDLNSNSWVSSVSSISLASHLLVLKPQLSELLSPSTKPPLS